MAEIKRFHCDVCGKPCEQQEMGFVNISGFPDASRDEVCHHCRARAAEAVYQLFDRAALRKLGLEAPVRQAAGTPQEASFTQK